MNLERQKIKQSHTEVQKCKGLGIKVLVSICKVLGSIPMTERERERERERSEIQKGMKNK
jgi:hypothetical protein